MQKPGGTSPAKPGEADASYVSKTDLIDWVNNLLQLQLTKLEQFASGAVFCQLLDAYFSNVVNINKVNFFAREEHDSLPNYKLLQSGLTSLNITRDINIQKLVRGSKVDTLELLQYLYKYLKSLQALEGYNARERRAMSVKGGTDAIPVPGWMASNFDNLSQGGTGGRSGCESASVPGSARARGGRGTPSPAPHSVGASSPSLPGSPQPGMSPSLPPASRPPRRNAPVRTSSGNWSYSVEPTQSLRSQLRASGSFNPAASQAAARQTPAASSAGSTSSTAGRRPCAPVRLPTAAAGKGVSGAGVSAAASAVGTPATTTPASRGHHGGDADDDERPGTVAVFRVVSHGEEKLARLRSQAEDPTCTTRLVVPDDAIAGNMARPLSPGGRGLLRSAIDAAAEGLSVLAKGAASCSGVVETLGTSTDNLAYRGKVRSLQDACITLRSHTTLLLSDIAAAVEGRGEGAATEVAHAVKHLIQELTSVEKELSTANRRLDGRLHDTPVSSLNLTATQLQRQLTSTAALDGAIRAIGTAQAALTQRAHREGAAIAARFLADPPAAAGGEAAAAAAAGGEGADGAPAAAAVPCKVLKMGDCAMKRLRNGDIYKGKYSAGRKNGEGCYCFTNADVYEGEFRDDRMAGVGVYSFNPEGRYEGEWQAATYEGAGSETFAKGSTYRGQYSSGLRSGWGVCRFYNGDYYEGHWDKGVREGLGMQQCTDDSNYVGEYAHGKRHGYGVYSFPNGDQYTGEYEEDLPQGYGVYVFASGQKYEGHWEKGKKHGWSIYTVETGARWAGNWLEGKPVWVHPLPAGSDATAAAGDASPAGAAQGDGASPDVAENLKLAAAACRTAQEAARVGTTKAQEHWRADGEVQSGLRTALSAAGRAADAAQSARAKAHDLGQKLHAAALLVEMGARGAEGIRLAVAPATPAVAHS